MFFFDRNLLPAQVELRDVTGVPINRACRAADDLHHIGEVQAFYQGERLDLAELPAVPSELASNKIARLSDWLEKVVHEDVAHTIAGELKGATKLELNARIATGSELDKKIQASVMEKARTLASDFPKTFGSNQRAKQTSLAHIATNISKGIRGSLRKELKANEGRIDRVIAAKVAQSLKKNASEDDDLFVSTAIAGYAAGAEDEYAMYKDMARRAAADATIDTIHYVYRAQPIACKPCERGKKENDEDEDSSYYKDYYYGRDVYERYNVFSGRAAYMEEEKEKPNVRRSAADVGKMAGVSPPSSSSNLRGARLRKKLYQEEVQQRIDAKSATPPPLGQRKGVPPGIPIEDEMPEFVPIPKSPASQGISEKATFVPFASSRPLRGREEEYSKQQISEKAPLAASAASETFRGRAAAANTSVPRQQAISERQPAFVKLVDDAPLPTFSEMLQQVRQNKNK
jgi:hypothetical protein